jgi:hypothetical protein
MIIIIIMVKFSFIPLQILKFRCNIRINIRWNSGSLVEELREGLRNLKQMETPQKTNRVN